MRNHIEETASSFHMGSSALLLSLVVVATVSPLDIILVSIQATRYTVVHEAGTKRRLAGIEKTG